MEKTIEYYMGLPYTIQVVRNPDPDDPGWVARVVELPGCLTEADTFKELEEMIADVMRGWVEIALEDGIPVPEPRPAEDYSGKFVVRVPKSLHRELVEAADEDGVSLNAYVNVSLGKSVGGANAPADIQGDQHLPVLNWPGLSEKARRALIANGMSAEAQEVDEQLFSQWVEEQFNQVQAASENGYYREALDYLHPVHQALNAICGKSPLVRVCCRMVAFLEEQMDVSHKLREGVIEQTLVRTRVEAEMRSSRGFRYRPTTYEYPGPNMSGDEKDTYKDIFVDSRQVER